MTPGIKRPFPEVLAAITALFVILFYFYVVLKLGYNIPVNDDYDAVFRFMLDYLGSGLHGKLAAVLSQHNEHRIVFNRIVTLSEYYLTGELDIRWLALVGNIGLLFLTAIVFKSFREKENKLLYFLPAVFLLFQLQYNESTFIAMAALSNFYVIVFAFLSIYLLSRERLIPALIFAVIATFTQGNGLFVFIVGIPLLFFKRKFREAAIWAAVFGVTAGVYFSNYSKPAGQPGALSTLLERPLDVVLYYLMFVGSSIGSIAGILLSKLFVFSSKQLIVLLSAFGLIVVLSFIFLNLRRYHGRNNAIYYFMAFLFITALSATVARLGLGIEQSLSSRYKFVSILFFILLYLAIMETIGNRKIKNAFFASVLALSVLFNITSYKTHYANCAEFKNTFTMGLLKWYIDKDYPGLFYPNRPVAASVMSEALRHRLFVPDFSPVQSKISGIELPSEGLSLKGEIHEGF